MAAEIFQDRGFAGFGAKGKHKEKEDHADWNVINMEKREIHVFQKWRSNDYIQDPCCEKNQESSV